MELGRCQSVNFGMKVDTSKVQGREAREVADRLAKWLLPVQTNATAVAVGDHMLKLTIHAGDGTTRAVKFSVADADLGKIAQRVQRTVGIA